MNPIQLIKEQSVGALGALGVDTEHVADVIVEECQLGAGLPQIPYVAFQNTELSGKAMCIGFSVFNTFF